jgi:tape measure domain-containing protein
MGYTASPGAVISVRVEGAEQSQRQIDSMARSLTGLAATAQNAVRSLAATAGIGGGVTEVAQLSDEYTKLTSQLKLATESQSEYLAAYGQVKRISAETQSALAGTGVLYARIANGTRELGISQQRVAAITEVVNLSLKTSGATAEESASAQLQLSQAFAAGALRGEEFNAVNEAAPRLMRALADGLGVPVGALKQMASEGKITSEVMADVLPKSLAQLRQEAAQVQTISGAFTVLKNEVLEYTATSAQANGSVALLTGGIKLLSDNLNIVTGVAATLTAAKLGTWLTDTAQRTIATAAANRTLVATHLANAEAQATATASASLLANARVAELRAATLAASGEAQLAVAANGLIPAQARAAAAAEAHAGAMLSLAVAQRSASTAVSAGTAIMTALGGPVGTVITLLGVAATAWSWYGSKAEEANKQAADSAAASTPEILANLDKQNEKLRERLALSRQQGQRELAKDNGPEVERLASLLKQINDLKAKGQELDAGDQVQLITLQGLYDDLAKSLGTKSQLKADLDASGSALTDVIAIRERLTGVNKQYLDDLAMLQNSREKGAISEKEYIELVSQLATETYKSSDAGKASVEAAHKEAEAYATLISAIRGKTDANRLELALGQNATDSQKESIKLDQELASGKLKLSAAHQAAARAALAEQAASEHALKLRDAQRDMNKYVVDGTLARQQSAAALQVEYDLYGKSADAREVAMVAVRAGADAEKKLADLRADGKPVTDQMIAQLYAERDARVLVEQATLGQGKALAYAAQLADENRRFAVEYIGNEQDKARALLQIDAGLWQERIRLAGDGTEAQKRLQEEYATWYQNQLAKPMLDANKKQWDAIEQTAHDTFISIEHGTKAAGERIRGALENGLFEWLWQITSRQWKINIGASVGLGGTGLPSAAGTPGADNLFGTVGGSAGANPLIGAVNAASALYKTASGGFAAIGSGIGQGVTWLGNGVGSGSISAFGQGMQGFGLDGSLGQAAGYGQMASTALGYGAGLLGGHYLGNAIAGDYSVNHGQAVTNISSVVGAVVAGPIGAAIGGAIGGLFNRAFGMGSKELTAQGMSGTLTATSLTGQNYTSWHQDGGWFRSDKNGTDSSPFSTATVSQFTQGLSAIELASTGFAKALGVNADAIAGYAKNFDLKLTGDAAKDQQTVADFFNGIGDEIALKLVPTLDQFEKSGETASAALQRLAGDFQSTDQLAQLIGKTSTAVFGDVGVGSTAARERLIDLAGGVNVLGQQAATYSQNFLTEAQRLAPVQESLKAALAGMGLAWIDSRDEFEAYIDQLVSSGAILTESGAKEFTGLMALNEAFAQVHPATAGYAKTLADIASEHKSLQDQYDELTMTSAQLRAKERAGIDATNLSLYDAVNALKDAKAATDALAQAQRDQASSLLGSADGALSVLQAVVGREQDALKARIDAETAVVDKLRSLSDALRGTLDGMHAAGQEAASRASAQAQIHTALAIAKAGGPLPDAASLQRALGIASQSDPGQFASYQDYLRDYYRTRNDIAQLGKLTDSQLSTEEQSLAALQAESKRLDAIVSTAQQQLAEAKGQSTTLLSIDQALQGFGTALAAALNNPVVAATQAVNTAYQSALGRAPDAAGLEFWQTKAAAGVPVSSIADAITNSPEAKVQALYHSLLGRSADAGGLSFWLQQGASIDAISDAIKGSTEYADYHKLHPFEIGTNYVPETMPALLHKGERVIQAGDNRELMRRLASPAQNGDVLVAEIRRLTDKVARLQNALDSIAGDTKEHKDMFDKLTAGGNVMLTEPA